MQNIFSKCRDFLSSVVRVFIDLVGYCVIATAQNAGVLLLAAAMAGVTFWTMQWLSPSLAAIRIETVIRSVGQAIEDVANVPLIASSNLNVAGMVALAIGGIVIGNLFKRPRL